ncbi:MAG: hypothetical protein R3Y26_03580 [Rikenellaceae bacterium]
MKKFLTAIVAMFLVMCSLKVQAQDYNYALGLSLGGNFGVNAKVKMSNTSAIEGGFDFTKSHNATNFYAVWQYHLELVSGLYGYAGGGANIGFASCDSCNSSFNLGIDPNLGIEYKFAGAPIALGLDYRPSINIIGTSLYSNASLKIRYTF